MKKNKDYSLLLLLIVIAIAVLAASCNTSRSGNLHRCIDKYHIVCDGECTCDGMECPPSYNESAYQLVPARDYQLELVEDTILVFDGHRFVGKLPMWDNSPLDSLLQKDNE